MSQYFNYFTIPFTLGMFFLFGVLIYKYIKWIALLPSEQRSKVGRALFSMATPRAIWRTIKESLLHVSIFKKNPLLGFMHASLAFGWFLLIVFGAMESMYTLGSESVMPHVHIFFKFFFPTEHDTTAMIFAHVMDFLLLIILVGVGLAWYKRYNSNRMGLRKTTKHSLGDRLALSALWVIFPARLVAESVTCGLNGSGGFLTGFIGEKLTLIFSQESLVGMELPFWWIYSLSLGLFFVSLPYSRYMHIFTEIPHIFLKEYGVVPTTQPTSIDNFHINSCSRCGICIDSCPMQCGLDITKQLPVYFLRDQRDRRCGERDADMVFNCLMCGKCETACPVDIDINMLRLNRRAEQANINALGRYVYLPSIKVDREAKVGYFSGCMTKLTPAILSAMANIFSKAGEDVVHLDAEGGACCGRPLMLSGEIDSSHKLIEYNKELINKHGVTRLVVSCPICLKVFKEDYALKGIEILHHSQYINMLIEEGKISPKRDSILYTYHDPCELGRGVGVYDEPRSVINAIGSLVESDSSRGDANCCGSSLAHFSLSTEEKQTLSDKALDSYIYTGAKVLVTSCPLCKSAFSGSRIHTADISEIVSKNI